MTPSELSALEQLERAYEEDPGGTWYALHDAYLECEPPREREAARVAMKHRNGWRWWWSHPYAWMLGPAGEREKWIGMAGKTSFIALKPQGQRSQYDNLFASHGPGLEDNRRRCEDWLLDHGY